MSVSDPIADMICIIKNGLRTRRESVSFPYSKVKMDIVGILKNHGFITDVKQTEVDGKPFINVSLKYTGQGMPVINDMKKQSKPGKREYLQKQAIPKVKNGYGIAILSTNKGVLSGKDARLNNVGGELLCKVW